MIPHRVLAADGPSALAISPQGISRFMMQNTSPLTELSDDDGKLEVEQVETVQPEERAATVWVSRLTGIVGGIMLLIALVEWFTRHGHYRLLLALLTVAMFCAILHSYVFEDGIH
jgi:hypothetical protein